MANLIATLLNLPRSIHSSFSYLLLGVPYSPVSTHFVTFMKCKDFHNKYSYSPSETAYFMPTYFSISPIFRAVHSGYLSVCSSQTFSPWIIYSLPVYAYLATSGLVFLFLSIESLRISFNRLHRALTQTNLIINLHGGVSEQALRVTTPSFDLSNK